MISIIDYDAGNIKSVEKALLYLGEDAVITSDRDVIMSSDRLILPGVGAFGDAMNRIKGRGLDKVIYDFVETGKPFLGICLGLQLLFKESEESPGATGLGLLDGKITKLPSEDSDGISYKVPQIGWNSLTVNPKSKLLEGIKDGAYVYFVHSFYLKADNPEDVAARTVYSTVVDAAVEKGNIMATQFHPEKSSEVGLGILKNFVAL
ncbi:MAG: imidazole glycerol phosphate synthase subunit HisH [Eubacterium sp.]|nr:imidazole glycerol phosphate synthase subunit HisH [Eubacterium sp.]